MAQAALAAVPTPGNLALGEAADVGERGHWLDYRVYWSGLNVASARVGLSVRGEAYAAEVAKRTSGLASVFVIWSLATASRGRIGEAGLVPLGHESASLWRGSQRIVRLAYPGDGAPGPARPQSLFDVPGRGLRVSLPARVHRGLFQEVARRRSRCGSRSRRGSATFSSILPVPGAARCRARSRPNSGPRRRRERPALGARPRSRARFASPTGLDRAAQRRRSSASGSSAKRSITASAPSSAAGTLAYP